MNVGTSKRPLSHALTATERKGLEQQLAPLVQHMPKAKRGNTLCSDARSKLNDEDRPVQHGICLGLITGFEAAERELCAVAVAKLPPDFFFTSIQLNMNYAAALHTDNNNLGESYILGLGEYTGGELYVDGTGTLDINGKFVAFNGLLPHMTVNLPNHDPKYVWNQRWSMVFFTNTTAKKLYLPEYAAELDTLLKKGYPAPPAASLATDSNRKATRLQYDTPTKMMEHAVQTIRGGHGDPCGVPPKAAYRQMVFSPLGKGSKAGTDGMSAKTAARPPNPEAGHTEVIGDFDAAHGAGTAATGRQVSAETITTIRELLKNFDAKPPKQKKQKLLGAFFGKR